MGSDEERDERDEQGVDALRADPEGEARQEPSEPEEQRRKIPQTRIGRSAKLGTAIGTQATRYAGTAAANVVSLRGQGAGPPRDPSPRDRPEDGIRPRAR